MFIQIRDTTGHTYYINPDNIQYVEFQCESYKLFFANNESIVVDNTTMNRINKTIRENNLYNKRIIRCFMCCIKHYNLTS